MFCLLSNFHRAVELYRLCHNDLIVEVKLSDQEYRMLSRDLKNILNGISFLSILEIIIYVSSIVAYSVERPVRNPY